MYLFHKSFKYLNKLIDLRHLKVNDNDTTCAEKLFQMVFFLFFWFKKATVDLKYYSSLG